MFRLPHRNVRDRATQECFEALEKVTFLHFPEYPAGQAPVAPSVGFILYAQDNGAGKTKAMIVFPTGAPVQIAIEP